MVNAMAPNAPMGARRMIMAHHTKQCLRELVDERDQRTAPLAKVQQGQAEQHRDQQHLKDFASGERIHERRRDDVENEIDRRQLLRGRRVRGNRFDIKCAGVRVDANARLEQIDHGQGDAKRKRGGHDLEVHERFDADASEVLDVSHRGNAGDDGGENHRGDDHP